MNRLLERFGTVLLSVTLGGCFLSSPCLAQDISRIVSVDNGPNSPQQISKHYVILVSFDGFRYDYAKRYHATNLLALAAHGASAPEGMIPAYPSVTFANHYTIVTGLYPEHHGLVGNIFYDPALKRVYNYHDTATVTDGSWYGGTPLWVVAEQQGMRSASMFWVGSEAAIEGVRPSIYVKYGGPFSDQKRVDQVLSWLRMPPAERPHFITLYFSDTDQAGHDYGPLSREVADAVHRLDTALGRLVTGLRTLKLPVDVIVVADHGMAAVQGGWVDLDQHGLAVSQLEKSEGWFLYAKSDADADKIVNSMEGKNDQFRVYRRAKLPAHLHLDDNPRAGDPVVIPNGPYAIRVSGDPGAQKKVPGGEHGYDPEILPDMKAVFVAEGPDIRSGVLIAPFENVNIYPLIAKILGLNIADLKTGAIDGKLAVLQGILKNPH